MNCYNDKCQSHNQDFACFCKKLLDAKSCVNFISEANWDKDPSQMVRDPKSRYYDAGGIEVKDIIKAKLTPEQYQGFLLGNVIKYSCRMNFKGQNVRDADKIAFYSMWLNEEMTEESE